MIQIIQFPIRFLVSAVAFFFYFMELSADWVIGVGEKTEYIRQGSCKHCGRCCRLLALEVPRILLKWEMLERALIWYHRFCFNFLYEGKEKNWLVYRCQYFQEKEEANRCRIYPFRHRLCRFFPRQRLYSHPKLHKQCGFKFVRRDGKPTFEEVLRKKLNG